MKFALVLLLALSPYCYADEILRLGSPAPQLQIERWIRGTPLQRFEKGQVYIVEFWATWCGPCVRAMPHLMEYQALYAAQGLQVIGVANREEEPNRHDAENKIETFLKERFPNINYAIGFEHSGRMNKSWMEPGLGIGIPHSFVIDRDGKVAFIGHPHYLKDILPKIMDGTWRDSEEAKAWDENRMKVEAPAFAHDQLVRPFYRAIRAAYQSQDWSKALSAAEAGLAIDPEDVTFLSRRAEILLHLEPDFTRASFVMKEFVELAKKAKNEQHASGAFNLLFGVEYDHSKIPQSLRLNLGDQIAELVLKIAEENSKQKYAYYPDLAQYFSEKGNQEKALRFSQEAVDALKNENEEYRARMIKAYGTNVAQQHANLTQEPVCIGDYCVLPKKCEELVQN